MKIKKGETLKINGKDYTITSVHYAGMESKADSKPGDGNRVVKYVDVGIEPEIEGGNKIRISKQHGDGIEVVCSE